MWLTMQGPQPNKHLSHQLVSLVKQALLRQERTKPLGRAQAPGVVCPGGRQKNLACPPGVLHRSIRPAEELLGLAHACIQHRQFHVSPPENLVQDRLRLQIQCLSLIHISEPTRLLSISYAVFCLKKKKSNNNNTS
eukprot:TRINITY_DN24738_c0_g1_i2.p1 TRINITY_DN24738_c0_g1~~TRINITY_DN24738_c0_g1_i2.p1  ORF type:complete len:136 (+),score=19.06 TRINITY_DN24738_c0_g1_i2:382-789(+)